MHFERKIKNIATQCRMEILRNPLEETTLEKDLGIWMNCLLKPQDHIAKNSDQSKPDTGIDWKDFHIYGWANYEATVHINGTTTPRVWKRGLASSSQERHRHD
jgi:hypothetical protein